MEKQKKLIKAPGSFGAGVFIIVLAICFTLIMIMDFLVDANSQKENLYQKAERYKNFENLRKDEENAKIIIEEGNSKIILQEKNIELEIIYDNSNGSIISKKIIDDRTFKTFPDFVIGFFCWG